MISDFIKINEELFININFINAISKETLLVWLCGDEEGIKISSEKMGELLIRLGITKGGLK